MDDSLLHAQRGRWPAAVSAGLSLGAHALLLAVATLTIVSPGSPPNLIHVSLLSGGGGGPAAAHQTNAAAPKPAPPPLHAEARPHAPARLPSRAHRHHLNRSADSTQVAAPASIAVEMVRTGNDAPGGGSGTGQGTGGGIGNGTGTGAGNGIDQRPACVYCPEPRYPFIARARGWQGTVDVGLLVLADGSVDAAALRRSSGYGVLDQAAITVARQSRFRPPAASGLPVPLHGRIEYRFELAAPR